MSKLTPALPRVQATEQFLALLVGAVSCVDSSFHNVYLYFGALRMRLGCSLFVSSAIAYANVPNGFSLQ